MQLFKTVDVSHPLFAGWHVQIDKDRCYDNQPEDKKKEDKKDKKKIIIQLCSINRIAILGPKCITYLLNIFCLSQSW
jgi:hypothetical protein